MKHRLLVLTFVLTGLVILWLASWSSYRDVSFPNPGKQNLSYQLVREERRRSAGKLAMPAPEQRNIFFVESSCAVGGAQRGAVSMSPRQACAVESAARANPGADIYYLDTCLDARQLNASSPPAADRVGREVFRYPNVKVFAASLFDLMKDTPLETWFQQGHLQRSAFPVEHSSDVIRLVVLWKYGGVYLDLDFIIFRSLEDLGMDFAVAERDNWIGNAALSFSAKGLGHEVAGRCLKQLAATFNGSVWPHNGPAIITKILSILCNTSSAKEMTRERCWGFTVHPAALLYPFRYESWRMMFSEDWADAVVDFALKNSTYGVHVWNKLSRARKVEVASRQPYALLAKRFCPGVFSAVDRTF